MQSKIIVKSSKSGYGFKITYFKKKYLVVLYTPNGGLSSKSFTQFYQAYSFYRFIIKNQFFNPSADQNSNQLSLFNRG